MNSYILLSIAIISEVTATMLLKASNGWQNWWFGITSLVLYSLAGFVLALVLKSMSVGLAYAIWSGVGIAFVCILSALFWQQKFDGYALAGVLLIAAGTLLISLKSNVTLQ